MLLPHSETNHSTPSSASLHKTVPTHPLPHSETHHSTLSSASGWHDGNVKSTKTASNVLLRWKFGLKNTYRPVFVLLTRLWERHAVKSSPWAKFEDLKVRLPLEWSVLKQGITGRSLLQHTYVPKEKTSMASNTLSTQRSVPQHSLIRFAEVIENTVRAPAFRAMQDIELKPCGSIYWVARNQSYYRKPG